MTSAREHFIAAQQRMLERYGVAAQSRFVHVPSISGQAHVLTWGSGPAVVMLNGIGTPAAMWAPLMAELVGFRLFAVDLPAYGLTATPRRFAREMRSNAVHFLNEVLDALELDRSAFVANSLGSLWASWLALNKPYRVAALVHVGCPAVVLDSSAPLPMRVLSVRLAGRLLTRLQPPSSRQVEQLSQMVNEHPLVPELAELLVATERLPDFRRMFLSTVHQLLRLRGSRPESRLTAEELAGIDQPTLLFWGEHDPFGSPAVGERIVAAMPAAKLHVIGGGHAPWLTQAQRIAPFATRFLQQHI